MKNEENAYKFRWISHIILVLLLVPILPKKYFAQKIENLIWNPKFKVTDLKTTPDHWDTINSPSVYKELFGLKKSYALLLYNRASNSEEYLMNELYSKLEKGKPYIVSFEVRRCNKIKNKKHHYLAKEIGVKFSVNKFERNPKSILSEGNQLMWQTLRQDFKWEKKVIEFEAEDDYKFVAFGPFRSGYDASYFPIDPSGEKIYSANYCIKNVKVYYNPPLYQYYSCRDTIIQNGEVDVGNEVKYLIDMKFCSIKYAKIDYDMQLAKNNLKVYDYTEEVNYKNPLFCTKREGKKGCQSVKGDGEGRFPFESDTLLVIIEKDMKNKGLSKCTFQIICSDTD